MRVPPYLSDLLLVPKQKCSLALFVVSLPPIFLFLLLALSLVSHSN